MTTCCCRTTVDTHPSGVVCPASGGSGAAVDLITLKALLKEEALSRLRAVEHRFCPDREVHRWDQSRGTR